MLPISESGQGGHLGDEPHRLANTDPDLMSWQRRRTWTMRRRWNPARPSDGHRARTHEFLDVFVQQSVVVI
jgi:hypothetical protein